MAINFTGSYSENFDSLVNTGTSSVLPTDWVISETGTSANANGQYTAGTGSNNAGDTYSFGAAGNSERALGGLQSGSLTPTLGTSFTNNTSSAIAFLNVAYTGEQWRLGAIGRADRLDFQYSLDATSLTTGTWVNVDTLDFTSPTTTSPTGALDGNAISNKTAVSATIADLNIPVGATFWFRWNSFDAAGADDGLAIDDFSILTDATPPPATTLVAIAAIDPNAAEANQDSGTFRISRTGDTADALTVSYTIGGSATNGTDYTPSLTETAVIAAGQTSVDITLTPVDDDLVEGSETVVLTLVNGADYDLGAGASATVTIADNDFSITPIYTIQGAAHRSPLVGQMVTTVGIVTAVDSNGYYLQDATGDGNIATSDGLFVFTSSRPAVLVGSEVRVSGMVSEFIPGGASTGNLSTTQITATAPSATTTLSTGNALPTGVVLGVDRMPPTNVIDDDQTTSYNVLQGGGTFDPVADGLDFYESLEGMRVTINDPLAVSNTNRFGEIYTVANNGAGATGLSDRGTINIAPNDFNPERIQVQFDSGILPGFSQDVNVGAKLSDVTGVVGYNFGNFEVNVTEAFTVVEQSTLTPEVTLLKGAADKLTVASYNVLNLDPVIEDPTKTASGQDTNPNNNLNDVDDDEGNGRFAAIAQNIISNLGQPDIIGLQEVQDNTGAEINDGVVSASVTLQKLIDAIVAAGGPQYAFIDNTFITAGSSGGQPGGNIRTAFLYNPNRVDLVDGSVTTIGSQAPSEAFAGARLPLVATFEFNGQDITVVNNHFSSKGGSRPLFGATQPAADLQEDPQVNGSLDERQAQAQAVKDYVNSLLVNTPDANIAVVGDFNEFEFISPITLLEQSLTNLTNTLPENERYSFIFDGNSQSLDHILVSGNLSGAAEFDIIHVNTEFADTSDRASDHDPLIARFNLPLPEVNVAPNAVNDGSLNATLDTPLTISVATLLANDTDVNANTVLQITNVGSASNGSVALNDNGTPTDFSDDSVIFTPNRLYLGAAAFEYTLSDGSLTNTATVALNVVLPNNSILGTNRNDNLNGNSTNQVFASLGGNDTINGNGGNDTLLGGDGNDTLNGGGGNDSFAGGNGNDQINGNGGNNYILAGAGNDRVNVGSGNDFVDGGAGNDVINSNGGNDTLLGGAGNDSISSGSGDDLINSGVGNDTIQLGGGRDVVILEVGQGFDRIRNFQLGLTRFDVSTGALSFVRSGNGVNIFQSSDQLAFVENVSVNTLNNNQAAIFI